MTLLTAKEEFSDAFDMQNIQKIIKQARKVRGLTQKELGDLVGVSAAQICKIEKSYKNITLFTVLEIFHALGVKAYLKPVDLINK